jgi:hypothetical protein
MNLKKNQNVLESNFVSFILLVKLKCKFMAEIELWETKSKTLKYTTQSSVFMTNSGITRNGIPLLGICQ